MGPVCIRAGQSAGFDERPDVWRDQIQRFAAILLGGAIGLISARGPALKGTGNVRDNAHYHAVAAAAAGWLAGRGPIGGDAGPVGLLWHRGVFRNAA